MTHPDLAACTSREEIEAWLKGGWPDPTRAYDDNISAALARMEAITIERAAKACDELAQKAYAGRVDTNWPRYSALKDAVGEIRALAGKEADNV